MADANRFIVIDCYKVQATIYKDINLATEKMLELVKSIQIQLGYDIEDLYLEQNSDFISLGKLVDGIISHTSDEEGSEGFFVGIDSGSRSSFSGKWPADKDDITGNGNPTVFKTAGVAEGIVPGIETIISDMEE